MKAIQREGSTLKYIAIEPDGYDAAQKYSMVILLHGFGAHMGDLASLAPAIDPSGYVYICPNAPIPFQIGPGMTGFGWTPPSDLRSADDIEHATDMLSTLVDEVTAEYGTPDGDVLLGGFSQGGMMTYRLGLPDPGRFKGLLVLSGVAPDAGKLRPNLPESRTQPVFVAHGTADMVLPVASARAATTFLRSEGYSPEYNEYPGMAHEISQAVLNDIVPWLHKTLPPFRTSA